MTLAEWVDLVAPRARTVAGVTRACERVLTAFRASRERVLIAHSEAARVPQSLEENGFFGSIPGIPETEEAE